MSKLLILLIISVLFFIVFSKIMKKFKVPKIGCLALVTGGVKCGKSTFAVYLAIKNFKRKKRDVRIRNYFKKLLHLTLEEEPLLYSNIPLAVPYVEVTKELLERKHRFRYNSVIYICEASLVADSQLIKDLELNERLLYFNKLIGHETKGGVLIYDTQSVSDCHYSIKRCLSEYMYIHHLVKWIPFFLVAYIREDRYSADNSVVAVNTTDIEETLKKVIIKKSTWKKFDCYCYSAMTDNLPVNDNVIIRHSNDLKCKKIVSFRGVKE